MIGIASVVADSQPIDAGQTPYTHDALKNVYHILKQGRDCLALQNIGGAS